MEKLDRKIQCNRCNGDLWITWSTETIRCTSCKSINQTRRSEFSGRDLKNRVSSSYTSHFSVVNSENYHYQESNGEFGSGSKRERFCMRVRNTFSRTNGSPNSTPTCLNGSPTLSPRLNSGRRPNQRAVLCGVSYTKQSYKLKGTIADVKNMRDLLIKHFNFPEEGICVLTEEETHPKLGPTKRNILEALKWLVKDCRSGESLVFFFSGHGVRQPEFAGDEDDGFDETICPVDFKNEGLIFDNDINDIIVKPLIEGVTLHAIIDACHSGTILDLPFVYHNDSDKWIDNRPPNGKFKGTMGGKAISLSACRDNQIAADTNAFSGNAMSGAMTYSFIKAIKQTPRITYGGLLTSIRSTILQANDAGNNVISKIFRTKMLQEPLLSASWEFDAKKTEFRLQTS